MLLTVLYVLPREVREAFLSRSSFICLLADAFYFLPFYLNTLFKVFLSCLYRRDQYSKVFDEDQLYVHCLKAEPVLQTTFSFKDKLGKRNLRKFHGMDQFCPVHAPWLPLQWLIHLSSSLKPGVRQLGCMLCRLFRDKHHKHQK